MVGLLNDSVNLFDVSLRVAFVVGKAQKRGLLWEVPVLFTIEPTEQSECILVALHFLYYSPVVHFFSHRFGSVHPYEPIKSVVVELGHCRPGLSRGPAQSIHKTVEYQQELSVGEVLLVSKIEENKNNCILAGLLCSFLR